MIEPARPVVAPATLEPRLRAPAPARARTARSSRRLAANIPSEQEHFPTVTNEELPDRPPDENEGMTLARASWSITAFVLFVLGAIVLIEGYVGYAIVTLVIACAATINLF